MGVWLVVTAFAALVYLPFLGSGRVLTTHEGFVTVPALQMLDTGRWLVPQYVDWIWVEKPPLVTWITALTFRLTGGFGEVAARIPAAASAIGLCLLVTLLAARFFGRRTALFAGLVQATCVYGYIQGRLGEVDFPFTFLLAAAHAVLLWYWGEPARRLPHAAAALFHTVVGLAVLTKGPLAVVFVGATVLAWSLLRRDWRPLRDVLWTPGVLCFLLVAGSWHAAVVAELGDFAIERWTYNYVDRFTGEHRLGARSLLYYIWTIPYVMLPWSVVLLLNPRRLFRDTTRRDARPTRFLWTWFLAGLLFLTISAGKHKHYCFPILPPLSILCATLLARHTIALGRRAFPTYATVFLVALAGYNIVGGFVIPLLDRWRPTTTFVHDATGTIPEDTRLYVIGLGHSPVYPYIARPYEYLDGMDNLVWWLQEDPNREAWILALQAAAESEPRVRLLDAAYEPGRPRQPAELLLVLARARLVEPAP